jgi:NADH-quinone oxidoreductase subunit F
MADIFNKFDLKKVKASLDGDRITVGLATCGISAGGIPVYDALKAANLGLPVEKVGCIGMCYNEPIVTVRQKGKKSIYALVTKTNVQKLIDCIRKNTVCKELFVASDIYELDFYKKQKRLVMENCGYIDPLRLDHYLAVGGYSGLKFALDKLQPLQVVSEMKRSCLRGRGGAGFSTGQKWEFIASAPGKKYLICNGDEGDPGAFMNRTVMESDPFKIIEGMAIGAYATGADEGVIYTRAEYPLAIETLNKAIKIAYDNNLLGKDIMGRKGFNFDLTIRKGAGAFVCGEETALLNSIEGKRGSPRPRPPFPAQKGLLGRPTVINNVSSWANASTIFKMGVDEFIKVGTEKTKGTKEICLTGNIKRPGVVEVPFGIKLREIIYDIGGGTPDGTDFKAAQAGGPAGGCIPKELLDTSMDYETMGGIGAIIGSGGLVVVDNTRSMVEVAKFFMSFTQDESCGKCTPCREGTKRLLEMLERLMEGHVPKEEIPAIKALAEFVRDNALCGLGQNAPNPILSTMKYFEKEYYDYTEKKCPVGDDCSKIEYFITEKCIGCTRCATECPVKCIDGEVKKRHIIDQKKCIKCGHCHDVCPVHAIDKRQKQ